MNHFFLYLLLLILTSAIEFRYPLSFTIVRNIPNPINASSFLNRTGCCLNDTYGNQLGYNLISLDGFRISSTLASFTGNTSPLSVWLNAFTLITGSRVTNLGNNTSSLQTRLLKSYRQGGAKLLLNAFYNESPASEGTSPTTLAQNLAEVLKAGNFDGTSIQFYDFNAVFINTAWTWLQNFLIALRRLIKKKTIVLILPATLAAKIDRLTFNGLVDNFVIIYSGFNLIDYNSLSTLLTNSSQYKSTAFKQILQKTPRIDLCRTLIAKPALPGKDFIDGALLGSWLTQNGVGWFGGYANLDFQADISQNYQGQVLSQLRANCRLNRNCVCY